MLTITEEEIQIQAEHTRGKKLTPDQLQQVVTEVETNYFDQIMETFATAMEKLTDDKDLK